MHGHVHAGESSIDACVREMEEELGIKLPKEKFEFIQEFVYQEGWEIAQIYFVKEDLKIEEMKLQEDEVSDVKYLKYEDFVELFYSNEFVPFNKEYKDLVVRLFKTRLLELHNL